MKRAAIAAAAVAASLAFATSAYGWNTDELYGITAANPPHLVSFAPVGPTITFSSDEAITGLGASDVVVGFDISPRDGGMYVLTKEGLSGSQIGRLWSLDPSTGSATLIGQLTALAGDTTSPYQGTLDGTAFGVDFNPQTNQLTVNSDASENLRVNPVNASVTTDPDLSPANIDPQGIAFSNNDNLPATDTVEYAYDFSSDAWGTFPPPDHNTFASIAGSGFTSQAQLDVGLDSAPGGEMYATHKTTGTQRLYTVVPATGAHGEVGPLPAELRDISTAVVNLIGVDSAVITAGEGAGTARVIVTRRNSVGSTTVNYTTADGTAVAGTDYTAKVSVPLVAV